MSPITPQRDSSRAATTELNKKKPENHDKLANITLSLSTRHNELKEITSCGKRVEKTSILFCCL